MEFDEKRIINENSMVSEPMPNKLQEEILKKGIKKTIGKIKIANINGTCFFLRIPILPNKEEVNVLLTNNHVINKTNLNKSFELEIDGEKKFFDNSKKRFKYTNENYDFTIIEILPSDNISHFLDIYDGESNDIKGKRIYIQQYPQKNKFEEYKGILSNSWGDILSYYNSQYIFHSCSTYEGSSGSPLILVENHKVIGLHRGSQNTNANGKSNKQFNIGYYIKDIIKVINENNKNIKDKLGKNNYKERIYKLFTFLNNKKIYITISLLILFLSIFYMFFVKKKIKYKNGKTKYFGYMLFGSRHGYGISFYQSGNIEYEGNWKNDNYNGLGKQYYDDEEHTLKYEGKFDENGLKVNGTMYFSNGTKMYEGGILNELPQGKGKEFHDNGKVRFHGYFINGQFYQGVLYDNEGYIVYQGYFKNSHYDYGELFYEKSVNIKYEGYFNKNNNPNGKGTIYTNNEYNTIRFSGILSDGKKVEGIEYTHDGVLVFNGTYDQDENFKKGELYFNGKKYVGTLVNNKIEGPTLIYSNEKLIFNGTFKNDLPNGNGLAFYEDGHILFNGTFKNGNFYIGILYQENNGQYQTIHYINTDDIKFKEEKENKFTEYFKKFKGLFGF